MRIHKIESDREHSTYGATVSLNYEELQVISNIFLKMEDDDKLTKKARFWELARNFHFIFDIVKNSGVDNRTFDNGYRCVEKARKLRGEDKEDEE